VGVRAGQRQGARSGLDEAAAAGKRAAVCGAGRILSDRQGDRVTGRVGQRESAYAGQAAEGERMAGDGGVEERRAVIQGDDAVLQGVGMGEQQRSAAQRGGAREGVGGTQNDSAGTALAERGGGGVVGNDGIHRQGRGAVTGQGQAAAGYGCGECAVTRCRADRDAGFANGDIDARGAQRLAGGVDNGFGRGVLREAAQRGRRGGECDRPAGAVAVDPDGAVGAGVRNRGGRAARGDIGVGRSFGRIDAARAAVRGGRGAVYGCPRTDQAVGLPDDENAVAVAVAQPRTGEGEGAGGTREAGEGEGRGLAARRARRRDRTVPGVGSDRAERLAVGRGAGRVGESQCAAGEGERGLIAHAVRCVGDGAVFKQQGRALGEGDAAGVGDRAGRAGERERAAVQGDRCAGAVRLCEDQRAVVDGQRAGEGVGRGERPGAAAFLGERHAATGTVRDLAADFGCPGTRTFERDGDT